MSRLKQLLEQNRARAQNLNFNPYPSFLHGEVGSSPKYLWIDCIDNYCTPHEIMEVSIDEVLIYKNLVHQVNHTDLNCISTLQYAIQILRVKHVIVCGHSNCFLLHTSTQFTEADLVEQWLQPLQGINHKYQRWLEKYEPESLRLEKICELNVIEQVIQLCKTTVVQNAWKRGQELTVHGWTYSAENNLLHNVIADIEGEQNIFPAYKAAVRSCIGEA